MYSTSWEPDTAGAACVAGAASGLLCLSAGVGLSCNDNIPLPTKPSAALPRARLAYSYPCVCIEQEKNTPKSLGSQHNFTTSLKTKKIKRKAKPQCETSLELEQLLISNGISMCVKRVLHNSQEVGASYMSIGRRIKTWQRNAMGQHSALRKEGNLVTCHNVDEPWGHDAKWQKPVIKRWTLHDSTYMRISSSQTQKVERRFQGAGAVGSRSQVRLSAMHPSYYPDQQLWALCLLSENHYEVPRTPLGSEVFLL